MFNKRIIAIGVGVLVALVLIARFIEWALEEPSVAASSMPAARREVSRTRPTGSGLYEPWGAATPLIAAELASGGS